MSFANKMAPGVSEGILGAEYESVADYRSSFRFQKLKMGDPIWRSSKSNYFL